MGSDSELIRLEQYIERLLDGYAKLKKEKQNIEQRLVDLQAANENYKQELDSLDSERGVRRARVTSLIGQIEQWETEIAEDAGGDDSAGGDEEDEEAEEDPEDGEPPAKKKSKAGKSAKAQKNLFSG